MAKEKELTETDQAKLPVITTIGNQNAWQLLSKISSSEGWEKTTRAMEIVGFGVVLQVTAKQYDNATTALVTVPSVKIVEDVSGGKKLIPE